MIDKTNSIYTKVKNAIISLCESGSQTYTAMPSKFPHMYFKTVNNYGIAYDTDNNENAVNSTIEIAIYTTGINKLTLARKISVLVSEEMRLLGFQRMFGFQEIVNVSDTNLCQILARYNRIIASEDNV